MALAETAVDLLEKLRLAEAELDVALKGNSNGDRALEKQFKVKNCFIPEVQALKGKVRDISESLLLFHPADARAEKVESRLWSQVFYATISGLRARLQRYESEIKAASAKGARLDRGVVDRLRDLYCTFLEDSINFYKSLIVKLQHLYGDVGITFKDAASIALPDAALVSAEAKAAAGEPRALCYRCLVNLGDLVRYKEAASPSDHKDYRRVRKFYLRASRILPPLDSAYNQLAVISVLTNDSLMSAYYLQRTLLAPGTPDSPPQFQATAVENLANFVGKRAEFVLKAIAQGRPLAPASKQAPKSRAGAFSMRSELSELLVDAWCLPWALLSGRAAGAPDAEVARAFAVSLGRYSKQLGVFLESQEHILDTVISTEGMRDPRAPVESPMLDSIFYSAGVVALLALEIVHLRAPLSLPAALLSRLAFHHAHRVLARVSEYYRGLAEDAHVAPAVHIVVLYLAARPAFLAPIASDRIDPEVSAEDLSARASFLQDLARYLRLLGSNVAVAEDEERGEFRLDPAVVFGEVWELAGCRWTADLGLEGREGPPSVPTSHRPSDVTKGAGQKAANSRDAVSAASHGCLVLLGDRRERRARMAHLVWACGRVLASPEFAEVQEGLRRMIADRELDPALKRGAFEYEAAMTVFDRDTRRALRQLGLEEAPAPPDPFTAPQQQQEEKTAEEEQAPQRDEMEVEMNEGVGGAGLDGSYMGDDPAPAPAAATAEAPPPVEAPVPPALGDEEMELEEEIVMPGLFTAAAPMAPEAAPASAAPAKRPGDTDWLESFERALSKERPRSSGPNPEAFTALLQEVEGGGAGAAKPPAPQSTPAPARNGSSSDLRPPLSGRRSFFDDELPGVSSGGAQAATTPREQGTFDLFGSGLAPFYHVPPSPLRAQGSVGRPGSFPDLAAAFGPPSTHEPPASSSLFANFANPSPAPAPGPFPGTVTSSSPRMPQGPWDLPPGPSGFFAPPAQPAAQCTPPPPPGFPAPHTSGTLYGAVGQPFAPSDLLMTGALMGQRASTPGSAAGPSGMGLGGARGSGGPDGMTPSQPKRAAKSDFDALVEELLSLDAAPSQAPETIHTANPFFQR